jgi:glucan 1,3-beta-glucosidase
VKRALKLDMNQKVRGVNLGGWFVLEPWITPSIFKQWEDGNSVKDEYTLCQTLGKAEALSRLSSHWSTWITQADFTEIASHGLNLVRIPIGYWSVIPNDGDPYVQGAYDHLGEALDWASAAGLKVMIDLHGGKSNIDSRLNLTVLTVVKLLDPKTASTTLAVLAVSAGRRVIHTIKPSKYLTRSVTITHRTLLWARSSSLTSLWAGV